MSISFYPALVTSHESRPLLRCACDVIESTRYTRAAHSCASCASTLNCNNRNASDLLDYLGIEFAPSGQIDARKLRELCIRRLDMDHAQAALPAVQHSARHFEGGRPADYLPARCAELLVIATTAGHYHVAWS